MEKDQRSTARHEVLKAATISVGGGAISCAARNLSDGAASLVESPVGIPDFVVIEIDSGDRHCRMTLAKGETYRCPVHRLQGQADPGVQIRARHVQRTRLPLN